MRKFLELSDSNGFGFFVAKLSKSNSEHCSMKIKILGFPYIFTGIVIFLRTSSCGHFKLV